MDPGATRQNLSGVGPGVSQGFCTGAESEESKAASQWQRTDCERTNKEEARYRRGGTFAGKEGSGAGPVEETGLGREP